MLEFTKFIEFLKNPQYLGIEIKETNLIWTALKVFLICYVVLTLLNGFIHWMLGCFFTLPEDKLEELLKSSQINRWVIFVMVTLVIPIIEEYLFRFPLVFKIRNIPFFFAIVVGIVIHLIFSYLPFVLVAIAVNFLSFKYILAHEEQIFTFWIRNFRFIVWITAVTFGLVHVGNFQMEITSHSLIVPFLVIPHIGLGFVLSYVRLTYRSGFFISVLVHIFVNTASSTIFLFLDSSG